MTNVIEVPDGYSFVKPLSSGGFGSVVEMMETSSKEHYAGKMIPCVTEKDIERIDREVKRLRQFVHPGIVKLKEVASMGNMKMIVMELGGQSLAEIVKDYTERNVLIPRENPETRVTSCQLCSFGVFRCLVNTPSAVWKLKDADEKELLSENEKSKGPEQKVEIETIISEREQEKMKRMEAERNLEMEKRTRQQVVELLKRESEDRKKDQEEIIRLKRDLNEEEKSRKELEMETNARKRDQDRMMRTEAELKAELNNLKETLAKLESERKEDRAKMAKQTFSFPPPPQPQEQNTIQRLEMELKKEKERTAQLEIEMAKQKSNQTQPPPQPAPHSSGVSSTGPLASSSARQGNVVASRIGADAIEHSRFTKWYVSGNVFTKIGFTDYSILSYQCGAVMARLSFTIRKGPTDTFVVGIIASHLSSEALSSYFALCRGGAGWNLRPESRFTVQNYKDTYRGSACLGGRPGQRVVLEADGREGKRTLKLSQDGETQPAFFTNIPIPFRFAVYICGINDAVEIESFEVMREPQMGGGANPNLEDNTTIVGDAKRYYIKIHPKSINLRHTSTTTQTPFVFISNGATS
ncbi:hypothetical protein BLNAU_2471 [Blattamonas nauphoetae]|uniref:non-specific serine/threonine protein kinase n=1 Tax=Blattamonas nauphoetae TaxID=2049346 RepID=A0ABQ9YFT6_9EUKA|nr:hypothetical protein BLNAU_2471 [Blattamonas nauphoetae]